MLKNYSKLLEIVKVLDDKKGEKLKKFLDRLPKRIEDCFDSKTKHDEVIEGIKVFSYAAEKDEKVVTFMNDINRISPSDQELTLFVNNSQIEELRTNEDCLAMQFTEVSFCLRNSLTYEKFNELEDINLYLKRKEKFTYLAVLTETNSSHKDKIIAS